MDMTSSSLMCRKKGRSDSGVSMTIGVIMNIIISSIFLVAVLSIFNSLVWSAEKWEREMKMHDLALQLSDEITEFSLFCERNQISSAKTITVPEFMKTRGYFIELSNSTRSLIIGDGTYEVRASLSQIPQNIKLQGRAYLPSDRVRLSYDPSSSTLMISEAE
ncbi:MAG: hypothetical protein PWR09_597 [Archaeoglobi archaeon]|nr:hypothetical protein [Archaeoglobi archaeon]